MRVTPIAQTCIDWGKFAEITRGTVFGDQVAREFEVEDADHLAEFAGRACYKAFDRKRPETATTKTYLANIIDQGHYSVFEHASVSFYVQGVSRSLLTELERHRFLSFSVESQRYVDQSVKIAPVVPPALEGTGFADVLRDSYLLSMVLYRDTFNSLRAANATVKEAREAARAFLPNATAVDFVVTGNLRCWRDVLSKRHHVAADAEIREFAGHVLTELRTIAPYAVQDIPAEPYGSAA